MTATVFEAKSTLSELIRRAQAGEKVVITSGREKVPVAELKALPIVKPRRLGFLKGTMEASPDDMFFAPLPDELTGLGDDPNDPIFWSEERIREENKRANEAWAAELAEKEKTSRR